MTAIRGLLLLPSYSALLQVAGHQARHARHTLGLAYLSQGLECPKSEGAEAYLVVLPGALLGDIPPGMPEPMPLPMLPEPELPEEPMPEPLEPMPDELPEVLGEVVAGIEASSRLPQPPKASKVTSATAATGLKVDRFM